MEKQNDSVRDRLLTRLPQPENLAAYREEVASLLAKHEKALAAEKWSNYIFGACVVVDARRIESRCWEPKTRCDGATRSSDVCSPAFSSCWGSAA